MLRLLDLPRPPTALFAARNVISEGAVMALQQRGLTHEVALVGFDDRHLDFRAAVGVDAPARLVRVTTTVRLHGWRGRVYFAPVRLLHPVVVRSMT